MIKTFKVRRETILRREDGTRVMITTALKHEYNGGNGCHTYGQQVDTCAKGKRTWQPVYDDNAYDFRSLPFNSVEREKYIMFKQLSVVSQEELDAAALELWEQMKP